ncbi:MAG TPA: hypothetical protein VM557_00025 [Thermoanaerobaculia bacterium]|nr:hypothetical protein [Thermoanaerobaculia bacterium]
MKNGLLLGVAALLLATGCFSTMERVHAPTMISWERAEEFLEGGAVSAIGARDGIIRLKLTDGREVSVEEPEPGALDRAIVRCGERCASLTARPRL